MQINPSLKIIGRGYANHGGKRRAGTGSAQSRKCAGNGSAPEPEVQPAMAALGLRLPGLGRAPVLGCRGVPGLGPAPVLGCRGIPPGLGAVPVPPGRSMAGHNRWSKVRNVKGPRDAERSRLFQRMSQLLRAAARGVATGRGCRDREGAGGGAIEGEEGVRGHGAVAIEGTLGQPDTELSRRWDIVTQGHGDVGISGCWDMGLSRHGAIAIRGCRDMGMSPAEGGPEPSLNPALAAVIQQCRSHNMPKATIEGALRSVRVSDPE